MKNDIEYRPNGLRIQKVGTQYHVQGSKNGPWDYLANARRDADTQGDNALIISAMEEGATHYDTLGPQWLKVVGEELFVWDDEQEWVPSKSKAGAAAVNNGKCMDLSVRLNNDGY